MRSGCCSLQAPAPTRFADTAGRDAVLDGNGRTFAQVKAERLGGDDAKDAAA